MKADDLAAYFAKKIAKPIAYDVPFHDRHDFFAIEPTAVRDNVLHVVASRKFYVQHTYKHADPEHLGETEIPLQDGDTVETVLDMALAHAGFGGSVDRLGVKDVSRKQRLVDACKILHERHDDMQPSGVVPGG